MSQYDLIVLREMLDAAFNVSDLRNLAFDYFREVNDDLPSSATKSEFVRRLIDYADRQGQIEYIVAYTQKENPNQYRYYKDRLMKRAYGDEQRLADLKRNIDRELKLLKDFEDLKRREDHPRRLLDIEANIKRQKEQLADYERQLAELEGASAVDELKQSIQAALQPPVPLHYDLPRAVEGGSSIHYEDFEIEIRPFDGQEYELIVRSPAGDGREKATFPFDDEQLKDRLLDVQAAWEEEKQAVQEFGSELFEFLFPDELRGLYRASLNQVSKVGQGLRLKLRLGDPSDPKLAFLPWEFLFDDSRYEYVCLSTETPVVRYIEMPRAISPLSVKPPLRILGMVANPTNFPEIKIEEEKQRLEKAVNGLREKGLVELHWLEGQTWRELQSKMRQGPWHIFHFIGHGRFDKNLNQGQLVFCNEQGSADFFGAVKLARLLANHKPMRLVLLNACEGASGGTELFSGTAPVLIMRGLPAVVAMQYPIKNISAVEFARSFYESLADGYPVDAAVAEARIAISLAYDQAVEWGMPALYMRAQDGNIFEVGGS